MDSFAPDVTLWEAWSPWEVARRLASLQAPWCVAGGWAVDLHLGRGTREHDDLEIAIPFDRFDAAAAALPDLDFEVVGDGLAWPIEHAGSRLDEHFQTWGRERGTGAYRIDVMREPTSAGQWVCRRDPRIRLPYDELIHTTDDGIPYACPKVILLFKAKRARPKDEDDFRALLPTMNADARSWLRAGLDLVHPGHSWRGALEGE